MFGCILQGNSNCECIVFDGNEIGSEAGTYFGDVFERNQYLTEIVSTDYIVQTGIDLKG